MRVAEDDRLSVGEARAHALLAPARGARVVDHRDPHALEVQLEARGQAPAQLGLVDVAVHRPHGHSERAQLLEGRDARDVAGVEDQVGPFEVLHAGRPQPARALRQVCVGDDRDDHDPTPGGVRVPRCAGATPCLPARRQARSARRAAPAARRRRARAASPQRAHVGLLTRAVGGDDRLQVGAGREQLVGEAGLAGAGPQQRLRRAPRAARPRGAGECERLRSGAGSGGRCRPRLTASSSSSPRRPEAPPPTPRMRVSSAREEGLRLAISISAASPRTLWTGRLWRAAVRSRHSTSSRATGRAVALSARDARQALEDRLDVALVAGARQRLALLARPLQAAAVGQAPLQLGGELEQVHDVLARVGELLGGERAGVPAREAGGLGDAQPEQLGEQRLVGGLRRQAREARSDLRVEDVRARPSRGACAAARCPGGRRARRPRSPGRRGPRPAARRRGPRPAGRPARSARPRRVSSGIASWIRHSSVR